VDSLIEDGYNRRLAYIPSLRDIPDYLDTLIQKDDMVIIMGAGDVTRVTDELLKKQLLQ
jgi:UDP-N-acetylmuramate-alanine ligase